MTTELYEKNMAVVAETYPDFHKWILDQKDQDWIIADGNQLHVSVGAVSRPVYDVDDPLKELSAIDTLPLHKENVSVFIGLGLGHTVARACEKMEKGHHVVIIEPVGQMYRLAFERYDFSEHIKSHTLLFAPGKAEVDMVTGYLEAAKVVTDWLVFMDSTCARRREYTVIGEHAMDILNQIQCNTGTVMSAGGKIADNDVATLPYVIRHRGVAELTNLFAGKPAVCVCTGPSLARNIHLLRAVQDKVVIIAVGQALRPLLAYDIRPDFICTVDFGDVNMTHYAGLCDETVPLVTINKTYAPLLTAYRGPKFISAGAYSVETTHSLLKDMGELPQGGSVAHMAFGLAANLGCSPIMIIGQDLALGATSHFNQADSMGKIEVVDGSIKWRIDDPRSDKLHGRDDIGMGPAQYVPGWWGEPVLTNTGLMSFITAMQRLIEQCPAAVINCTEGGAHLVGSRRMFFADALAKYCEQAVDKSVLTPLLTLHPDADARIAAALPLLVKDIKTLDIIIEHAGKALATVFRARNTKTPGKLKKILEENLRHSEVAAEAARRLPPINLAIYGARRQIQSRALNVDGKMEHVVDKKNRKDLLTRLERNELVLKAARDAAVEMRKTYTECQRLLTAYADNPAVLDPTGETTPADLSDADHYLDIGNFARPLLEAKRVLADALYGDLSREKAAGIVERALNIRAEKILAAEEIQMKDYGENKNLWPQYFDLIEDSRRIGRDDKNMDAALAKIREAIDLIPGREEARWGLASVLMHLGRYDEAVAAYADLVKLFPDKPRYAFEYGQTLVLAGRQQDGLEKIRAAMTTSEEFDHFFGALASLYAGAGMREEALAVADKHLERFPHDREVLAVRARLSAV